MPLLVNSPTELTTAATDLILALMAFYLAVALQRFPKPGFYSRLWQAVFISLAFGSLLGAIAHGIRLDRSVNDYLWHPIYFFLALTMVLLALAAIHDRRGELNARRLLFWLLPAPFVVVLLTWLGQGEFLIFILFEAIVVFFLLIVYFRLALLGKAGAKLILAAVFLTVAAAIVQSIGPFTVRLIWLFDHNGLFHLVQMPGVILFYLGASRSMKSESDL